MPSQSAGQPKGSAMTETAAPYVNKPAWVDLSSPDVAASGRLLRAPVRLADRRVARTRSTAATPSPRTPTATWPASGPSRPRARRRTGWSTWARPTRRHSASGSRRPAARSSPRRSTWATRAAWRSSRIPAAPSSPPGSRPRMDGFHADGLERVRLGRAQLARPRQGDRVLRHGLRLDGRRRAPMGEGAPPYTTFKHRRRPTSRAART